MPVKTFLLPDLGEGLTEAEIVSWLVEVGQTVAVDQPIVEVETAKSMVEVPSPFAGVVSELFGAAGDTMDVGKPLVSISDGAGEAYREEERAGATAPSAEPAAPAEASPKEESGSGNVLIGYGTPGGSGATRRTRRPRVAAPAAIAKTEAAQTTTAPLVVSPLVRKLAREHGIDVARIAGSGPRGLVLRHDVESAIGTATDTAPPTDAAPPTKQSGDLDARSGLGMSRMPVKGVRKSIAQAMTRSRAEIPEATVWVDVDATALVEMRGALKKVNPTGAPGLLAFIARFVLAGLAKYPELNTRVETAADGSQEIVSFDGVNLGFAAQTDRGLMVPSIRQADRLSARELDAELKRLAGVAREGKATPADLTSGTFTLNNYGVFGVDGSAAIINYPEAAILGVGRIIDRPWVVDGQLAIRKVTELTLTFDHRVCDGGTAGGFLRYVADAIENPGSVLADL
ncbi:dihydrolipoamide acetyltransferase family protein [Arthrobacter sp. KK5.5]|uniref:dihydrolipoamide acetyltransferase family protein n=1 Tax=Arthrobacter sp. KK5.5 TaxID=3373084 RepID=UPI003EE44475